MDDENAFCSVSWGYRKLPDGFVSRFDKLSFNCCIFAKISRAEFGSDVISFVKIDSEFVTENRIV